ncbi:MAG: 50S ribosomal protein L22 [Patescibacteria group bacterium]|nr:50S ribosomal protein L22 [Patescibacteria group bacterium]
MIESRAKLKHVRISPKKARLVADAIRGLDVVDALDRLPIIFKKSSPIIEKLLKSAVANMTDKYELGAQDLKIKSILVNKGKDLKRFSPAAFGRAHPYYKHASHIEIVLVAKEGVKPTVKEKATPEIETVDLTKITKEKKEEPIKSKSVKKDKVKDEPKQSAGKKNADKNKQ